MICQRSGCTNEVPPGRRKYCSTECGKIVNRRSPVDEDLARYSAILRKRSTKISLRVCLVCDKKFLSEGPWNRICPACNGRNILLSSRSANTAGSDSVASDEAVAEYLEEL